MCELNARVHLSLLSQLCHGIRRAQVLLILAAGKTNHNMWLQWVILCIDQRQTLKSRNITALRSSCMEAVSYLVHGQQAYAPPHLSVCIIVWSPPRFITCRSPPMVVARRHHPNLPPVHHRWGQRQGLPGRPDHRRPSWTSSVTVSNGARKVNKETEARRSRQVL